MDEFTSISIWVFMTFLIVNSTIIWFASSNTFSSNNNFYIEGLSPNETYGIEDTQTLQNEYYNQQCASATPSDPAYAGCVINSLSNLFNSTISLPAKLIGSLWTFLTAWYYLLQAIFSGVPAGSLFVGLLVPFFGLIQAVSILIIILRVASIIRGV